MSAELRAGAGDADNDPIVISGVGSWSAAGRGLGALRAALEADAPCWSPLESALPVPRAARVLCPIPAAVEALFPDDRKGALAMVALEDALDDAMLSDGLPYAPRRRALFVGTGLSSVTPEELAADVYPHLRADQRFDRAAMARDLAADRAAPRRHLPAQVTAALAARIGAMGPTSTSFSACAAAAQAIAEGLWALRRGEADVAVVGGHDAMIHPLGLLSFVVLGALSPTACRPFDRDRDGFMIGEGAAYFVLERASAVRARGGRARATLLGAGTSADAWNATAPHPEGAGAERSMRRALRDAGLAEDDVDYVNCHGTGTPLGDEAETRAVHRVFGDRVPVSSVKGAIGHTIAAAGALECAACVAALEGGFLPGTVGLETLDPELRVPVVARARPASPRAVISNSFGFGGQNCSLLLSRAP